MGKKEAQKGNKKTIWIMLIIVVGLAAAAVILYIPREMGFSNLSCDQLNKENILIIDNANYCLNDDDCIITADIVMHMCGCYELVNKNINLGEIKNKRDEIDNLYREKSCPIPSCAACNVPSKDSIRCINKKCIIPAD